MAHALAIIRSAPAAEAMLEPKRRRILAELSSAPNSAAGLSKQLNIPRQKINYHLHLLEQAGLVEPTDEERRGPTSRRMVRARARYFLISPEAMEDLAPHSHLHPDEFSTATLAQAAARIVSDLGTLVPRARAAGKRLATLSLETEISFRSPQERSDFAARLTKFLAEQAAHFHAPDSPGSRPFRVVTGVYPKITQPADGNTEPALLEEEPHVQTTEA